MGLMALTDRLVLMDLMGLLNQMVLTVLTLCC
jgi:hypothetical protein